MRKKTENQPDLRAGLSPETKKEISQFRLQKKLVVIGQNLTNNTMSSFAEVLAIISETKLAEVLNISFYTFRKKVYDPNEFTRAEMIRMSQLFKVPLQTVFEFIGKIADQKGKKRGHREAAKPKQDA